MFKTLAILTTLLVGAGTMAKADQISIAGPDIYDTATTTILFTGPGLIMGDDGIFSVFTAGLTGPHVNMQAAAINYGAGFTPTVVFAVSEGLNSLTATWESVTVSGDPNSPIITGLANLDFNGTIIPGVLTLTTQGGSNHNVSFSATASPVPEPASLALFGTGLLGIVGITRRKFNV